MTLPGAPAVMDLSATVHASVTINSMPLPEPFRPRLVGTVVDTRLFLPDMFELTFEDGENNIVSTLMVRIGSLVEVSAGASGSQTGECLIKGEVTSIEGDYNGTVVHTVIRGYEKSHRLQRASRTRTFVDMKDSDVASKIARDARLTETDIVDTKVTHRHLSQVSQTDWDFLRSRAQEIGYETGVAQGKFFFRPASTTKPESGGGLAGAAAGAGAGAVASALGGGPATLTFQQNLRSFRPRQSAANLPTDVEVRVYDYQKAEVVVGSAPLKTGTAKLASGDPDPANLANQFTGLPFPVPQLPDIPGLPKLGLFPSTTARVVVDRPADWGSVTGPAAEQIAKSVAESVASTVLEAEGVAYGDPRIQAGKKVVVAGVAPEFAGEWIVTAARHRIDPLEGGYSTTFEVSGRHDRSLLGLTTLGRSSATPPKLAGNVIGVVTNNNDPDHLGRVKLCFPSLAPDYESDWARVVQAGMGKEWGCLQVPEVGDEVLVGFEFGDTRRPYVLGGLVNGKNKHPLLAGAVKAQGLSAQVVKRGIVSRTGNQLTFEDEIRSPLVPKPPAKGTITLGDADGKVQLFFDTVNGELKIVCAGGAMSPVGKITIEQTGPGGEITVSSAGDVTVEASAPGSLTLKGGTGVTVDGGTGAVDIKGANGVTVNGAAGGVKLSGTSVALN